MSGVLEAKLSEPLIFRITMIPQILISLIPDHYLRNQILCNPKNQCESAVQTILPFCDKKPGNF
jgi:hypothetical protein